MRHLFISFFSIWAPLPYVAAFLGMLIEGDTTTLVSAYLARGGWFKPAILFVTLVGGSVIGDIIWYYFGVWLRGRGFARFHRWADKLAAPFDDHLIHRQLHTIFFSKFTYGLYHSLIVRAGILGLSLKRLIYYDFVASVPWILLIGSLGYGSHATFTFFRHYLKYAEIGLLITVILFVLLEKRLTKYLKRRI